ncbi:MAG: ferritin family protein [Candidatus Krumholzibacteriota bacterium]|nr:ferritin family protein [Candidatus Krumholzibacteriota bacterium]
MSLIDARELIRMAKRDEDIGVLFYEALAEKAEDPQLRARFLEIRKQEIGHAESFQEMLDGLGDYVPQEEYGGQYEHYYDSFLSQHEFLEGEGTVEKARAVDNDTEAIKFALGQEKNTLLFFLEMQELITSNQHKSFVQAVIEEERGHIAELSEMLLDRG